MYKSRLLAAMAIVAAPLVAAGQSVVDTGSVAPNFTGPGANMAGVIPSVSLASYRGKTVVLAFFPKARTKG